MTKFLFKSFPFILAVVLTFGLAGQVHKQSGWTEFSEKFTEADALEHMNFYSKYGNHGIDFDIENMSLTFKHQHVDDELTYQQYRVDVKNPKLHILEFHLFLDKNDEEYESINSFDMAPKQAKYFRQEIIEKRNPVIDTHGFDLSVKKYRQYEGKRQLGLDFLKALRTFSNKFNPPIGFIGSEIEGSLLVVNRINHSVRYYINEDHDGETKIFKIDHFELERTPQGFVYRVKTQIPRKPITYETDFQNVEVNLLDEVEFYDPTNFSMEQYRQDRKASKSVSDDDLSNILHSDEIDQAQIMASCFWDQKIFENKLSGNVTLSGNFSGASSEDGLIGGRASTSVSGNFNLSLMSNDEILLGRGFARLEHELQLLGRPAGGNVRVIGSVDWGFDSEAFWYINQLALDILERLPFSPKADFELDVSNSKEYWHRGDEEVVGYRMFANITFQYEPFIITQLGTGGVSIGSASYGHIDQTYGVNKAACAERSKNYILSYVLPDN